MTSDPDLPALQPQFLQPIDAARLEPEVRASHPPRILLLYGSLRERSYSRLMVEEAARILQSFGAETRIFDPRDLPLCDSVPALGLVELTNAANVVLAEMASRSSSSSFGTTSTFK